MIIEQTRMVQTEQKTVTAIQCDVCKKEYPCEGGIAMMETQEFVSFSFRGGYGSIFGDGSTVACDICQHCLKKLLGDNLRVE